MKGLMKYVGVAVKGACMGAADVIPGVSGGTIAFIMGIYDEFVGSIASINAEAVRLLLKGKIREFWKHINGNFLLSLVAGIGISVVALAGLMQMLLSDHPIQTWAFFFGLIVASSIFIIRGISGWKMREGAFLVLGVILGVVICTLSPTNTPDALWFVFISGAIAICAMILPGISGSFILLILGKYQFIMENITTCVENIGALWGSAGADAGAFWNAAGVMVVFMVGAVVGILAFSKFLHWLLARWNKETLIVLAGFIIGSLVKVWPWSNTEAIVCSQFPAVAKLGAAAESLAENPSLWAPEEIIGAQKMFAEAVDKHTSMIDPQIGCAIIFALIGLFLVIGIEIAGKHIAHNKAK
jgi:putative membrane protein